MLKDVQKAMGILNENKRVYETERKFVVYGLFQDSNLVYIGKSTNLHLRLSQHARDKEFNSYSYIEVDTEKEMGELESILIMFCKPYYNKELPVVRFMNLKKVKDIIYSLGEGYEYNPKFYINNLKKIVTDIDLSLYEFNGIDYMDTREVPKLLAYVQGEEW